VGLFVGIRGVEDVTPDYLREDVTPEHPITHSSKKRLLFSRNDGMNERYIRIISHFFYLATCSHMGGNSARTVLVVISQH